MKCKLMLLGCIFIAAIHASDDEAGDLSESIGEEVRSFEGTGSGFGSDYEEVDEDGLPGVVQMEQQSVNVFQQLSGAAKAKAVAFLQSLIQPSPLKKPDDRVIALACRLNQLTVQNDVTQLKNLITASERRVFSQACSSLDSNGLSVADHVLMLSKADRTDLISAMYEKNRNVLRGGFSRLCAAIKKNDVSQITFLLTFGASERESDDDGKSALMLLKEKVTHSIGGVSSIQEDEIAAHELVRAFCEGRQKNFEIVMTFDCRELVARKLVKKS